MTHVISSVLYRIGNRKRSMVTHHDSLKLCSDCDLPTYGTRSKENANGG